MGEHFADLSLLDAAWLPDCTYVTGAEPVVLATLDRSGYRRTIQQAFEAEIVQKIRSLAQLPLFDGSDSPMLYSCAYSASIVHAEPTDLLQVRKKLGQLQPFIAVLPQGCMGQLASFGPT